MNKREKDRLRENKMSISVFVYVCYVGLGTVCSTRMAVSGV